MRKFLTGLDMTGRRILGLPTPSAADEAVNKAYVDSIPTFQDGYGIDSSYDIGTNTLTVDVDLAELDRQLDGWYLAKENWIYGSATLAFLAGVATPLTQRYIRGTKISWDDGTVKYGTIRDAVLMGAALTGVSADPATDTFTKTAHTMDVQAAFFGIGMIQFTNLTTITGITANTPYHLVNLTANTFQVSLTPGGAAINLGGTIDAGVATNQVARITLLPHTDTFGGAAINSRRYSNEMAPIGHPIWLRYTPTEVGWTATLTNTVYLYKMEAGMVTLNICQLTNGTSNATLHTITLPIASASAFAGTQWKAPCFAVDGGTKQVGLLTVAAAATVCQCHGVLATEASTATLGSRVHGTIMYAHG